YGGVTTPLTYTFACSAYAGVYRAFCHLMNVPQSRIAANSDLFPNMLGHFRGRVYYNLYNWYRLIALLPGYRSNRVFMEQMMGVREAMPDEIIGNLKPPGWRGRLRDRLELFGSVLGLGMRYLSLGRLTRRFHKRLEAALAGSSDTLETMRLDELAQEYRRLERTLLSRWDAPLVNDFFTMICFGVLRRSAERWAGEQGWGQVGRLLGGAKGMVSIEPAQQIAAMGEIAAATEGAAQTLGEAEPSAVRRLLRNHPSLNAAVATYLDRFGDRCMEELKLESPTLHEEPSPLWRAVGRAAVQVQRGGHAHEHTSQVWSEAWHELQAAVGRRPLRKAAMYVLVRAARRHLILRENLRFERTRVFGRVRRIVLQMGKRLADRGILENAADVFYLEIGELFDAAENDKLEGLRTQASARRTRFEQYAQQPAPPSRFETHGSADLDTAIPIDMPNPVASDLPLQGTGCYPGVVRAVVRCVHDPQHAQPQPGQILVAERTDPGWVMLFPGAAGVLVQRGSILSHSATLAREMGIPTIVGLPRLMDRLHDGDLVEMDGAAGTARVVESADGESAPTSRRSEG
ncbi:MAG: PEP-utilizing enzyme, partial [Phycisphaeraceae bacterium]